MAMDIRPDLRCAQHCVDRLLWHSTMSSLSNDCDGELVCWKGGCEDHVVIAVGEWCVVAVVVHVLLTVAVASASSGYDVGGDDGALCGWGSVAGEVLVIITMKVVMMVSGEWCWWLWWLWKCCWRWLQRPWRRRRVVMM
jgi:hypothetical protein